MQRNQNWLDSNGTPVIMDLLKEYLELGQLSHRTLQPQRNIEPLMGPRERPPEFYRALQAVRESGLYPDLENRKELEDLLFKSTQPRQPVVSEKAKNHTRGTNYWRWRENSSDARRSRNAMHQSSSLRRKREETQTAVDSLDSVFRNEAETAIHLEKTNEKLRKLIGKLKQEEARQLIDMSRVDAHLSLLLQLGNEKVTQLQRREIQLHHSLQVQPNRLVLRKYFTEDDINSLIGEQATLRAAGKSKEANSGCAEMRGGPNLGPDRDFQLKDTLGNGIDTLNMNQKPSQASKEENEIYSVAIFKENGRDNKTELSDESFAAAETRPKMENKGIEFKVAGVIGAKSNENPNVFNANHDSLPRRDEDEGDTGPLDKAEANEPRNAAANQSAETFEGPEFEEVDLYNLDLNANRRPFNEQEIRLGSDIVVRDSNQCCSVL